MTLEWLQPVSARAASNKEDLPPWLFWTYLGVSIGLVTMAGLASGLTLGLMSLDELDLEVLKRSGTEQEKKHARRIMPVIENEHFLLVTLLLCNALAAEALPIFLDKLVDPVTAVLLSVSVVLVIGEILPQAVCRSYGLQVGSYSAFFVRLLMFVSAPVTWPIGRLLDWLLGDEQTALFRRAQLKALVGLHSSAEGLGGNLSADEISIITGALDLTSKTAWTAMTPLDKVFMLPSDRRLDEATLQDVLVSGHSRVPVHEPGNRRKLHGLILVKELVLVDPEEGLSAGQLVSRSLPRLPADTPMYQLLRLFEAGGSHMVALTRPKAPVSACHQDPAAAAGSSSSPPAAAAVAPVAAAGAAGAAPGALGLARSSSATGGLQGLHRIKSGVIKTSEKELYIEAEQRVPISPQGSWGMHPSPGSWGSAAVIGSPVSKRDSSGVEHGCVGVLWGADVQEGDPVGIITIEDVIEELLQQEIIDETDQYVDNLQVTRVDAYNLTTSLPPRLRKAYAQQFTPRVGRLVVHHPSHHHQGTGSWKGLSVIKQQQFAPRGAYSNPTTPLAGTPIASSPESATLLASALPAALAAMAAGGSGSSTSSHLHPHSRLSSESHHSQQHLQHMEQVPERQQLRLGAPSSRAAGSPQAGPPGQLGGVGHGLHRGAAHLPTQSGQHPHHIPAALLARRNSADTPTGLASARVGPDAGGAHSWGANAPQPGSSGSGSSLLLNSTLMGRQARQQQQQQVDRSGSGISSSSAAAAVALLSSKSSGSVPMPGVSRAHSGNSRAGVTWDPEVQGGDGTGAAAAGGGGSGGAAAGFGSVVEVEDGLKEPLLGGQDSDDEEL